MSRLWAAPSTSRAAAAGARDAAAFRPRYRPP
jgi:hypothetical protein